MTELFKSGRNSSMKLFEVYFWTTTIHNWIKLLSKDDFKVLIVNCLRHLVQQEKIKVYGFVVMPNHVHIIWEMMEMNGKEMPYASFQKFTAHQFQLRIRADNTKSLKPFFVDQTDRKYRFWQRDSLAIKLLSREMCEQKLDYIHLNPLQEHWSLVNDPATYHFSSCGFYEKALKKFEFLTDYRERFS